MDLSEGRQFLFVDSRLVVLHETRVYGRTGWVRYCLRLLTRPQSVGCLFCEQVFINKRTVMSTEWYGPKDVHTWVVPNESIFWFYIVVVDCCLLSFFLPLPMVPLTSARGVPDLRSHSKTLNSRISNHDLRACSEKGPGRSQGVWVECWSKDPPPSLPVTSSVFPDKSPPLMAESEVLEFPSTGSLSLRRVGTTFPTRPLRRRGVVPVWNATKWCIIS